MRPTALLAGLLVLAACQPDADAPGADAPDDGAEADVAVVTGDLAPVDDGAEDPAFAAFRDTLRAVVARRDTAALLAVVAPDARLSYGDDPGGPDGLRAMWLAGETPTGAPVWATLRRLLDGGSVDEEGAVTLPFVAALWPQDLDPFEHVAVTGRDVPARAAPDGNVVARVTEAALPVTGPASGGWRPVRLPDGREAVVADSLTASPVGYRAVFWDDGDGWLLRSFLAGD